MKIIFSRPSVLVLFIILIALNSCKKNSSVENNEDGGNGEYYLRFNSNGIKKEFTGFTFIDFAETRGIYNYVFQGRTSLANMYGLTISVHTDALITSPSTFTFQDFHLTNTPQTHIGFLEEDKTMFVSMTKLFPEYFATISITEVTPEYMKGTFSGKLTNQDWSASRTITNGEFKLKRAR